MVDDNRADESCEVIEATRVEKATERTSEAPLVVVGSPKTPPPSVPSKGQVETVLLEERSKRAAENEDLVEAPVSKAARNAPIIFVFSLTTDHCISCKTKVLTSFQFLSPYKMRLA